MRSLVLVVLLGACGGSDAPHEPLISTSVTGSYAGASFTPADGFATIYMDSPIIAIGDAIQCGSESARNPPSGFTVVFELDSFDVGMHSSFTTLISNVDGFTSIGSSDGTVDITGSDSSSVTASVSYAFTDPDTNDMYNVSGMFEAIVCP